MVRIVSTVLGMALGILWVVGLTLHATPWLAWMNGLAFNGAYLLAAANPREGGKWAALGPLFMSGLVGPLFLLGLLSGATPWLVWSNFAIAGVFGALAAYMGNRHAEVYRPSNALVDW
jgi:hypothetical protein